VACGEKNMRLSRHMSRKLDKTFDPATHRHEHTPRHRERKCCKDCNAVAKKGLQTNMQVEGNAQNTMKRSAGVATQNNQPMPQQVNDRDGRYCWGLNMTD
jgi:hypothetical protein